VEWQLALARQLGFDQDATLDHDQRFHAAPQPVPHKTSVLPSRLFQWLRDAPLEPFVARAGNGIVFHRHEMVTTKPALPMGLMQRVKSEFDPNDILPGLRV
jgi:hypothetical protein